MIFKIDEDKELDSGYKIVSNDLNKCWNIESNKSLEKFSKSSFCCFIEKTLFRCIVVNLK